MEVSSIGVDASFYIYDVVVKSSRSLSHFLTSCCSLNMSRNGYFEHPGKISTPNFDSATQISYVTWILCRSIVICWCFPNLESSHVTLTVPPLEVIYCAIA